MGPQTFPYTPTPTLAGYMAWFPQITGIPTTGDTPVIPPDSIWWNWAYNTATGTVNTQIAQVPGPFYLQAVYNLAAHWQVMWTPDPDPPVLYPKNNRQQLGWLAWLRKQYNLGGFTPGVVQTTADQGTATGLLVSDTLKNLTIDELQMLKTPWGTAYLGIASKAGTIWGLA
jgi:hypothetical protein